MRRLLPSRLRPTSESVLGRRKVNRKPKLDDPIQLFSLVEVLQTLPNGRKKCRSSELTRTARGICRCKLQQPSEDGRDLPTAGGGCQREDEIEAKDTDLLRANPPSQDTTPDLTALDNLNEAALLHTMGSDTAAATRRRAVLRATTARSLARFALRPTLLHHKMHGRTRSTLVTT